ncbi:MAG: S26 family signal peptidase [Clostridia bacterium]
MDFDDILMEEALLDSESPKQEADQGPEHEKTLTADADADTQRKAKNKKNRKLVRDILSWVKELAIAVLIVWFILSFVAQNNKVIGSSMQPTVYENDMRHRQQVHLSLQRSGEGRYHYLSV